MFCVINVFRVHENVSVDSLPYEKENNVTVIWITHFKMSL